MQKTRNLQQRNCRVFADDAEIVPTQIGDVCIYVCMYTYVEYRVAAIKTGLGLVGGKRIKLYPDSVFRYKDTAELDWDPKLLPSSLNMSRGPDRSLHGPRNSPAGS